MVLVHVHVVVPFSESSSVAQACLTVQLGFLPSCDKHAVNKAVATGTPITLTGRNGAVRFIQTAAWGSVNFALASDTHACAIKTAHVSSRFGSLA